METLFSIKDNKQGYAGFSVLRKPNTLAGQDRDSIWKLLIFAVEYNFFNIKFTPLICILSTAHVSLSIVFPS